MASMTFKNFLKKYGVKPVFQERTSEGRTFHSLSFGMHGEGDNRHEVFVSRAKGQPDLSKTWLNANFAKLVVMMGTTQTGKPCYTVVESTFENHDEVLDFGSMIG